MTDVSSLTEALEAVQDDNSTEQQEAKNYLDNLVGDGKKYSNAEELAKAYINADMHIHELREKLDERSAKQETLMNEVLSALREPKNNERDSYEQALPKGTGPAVELPDIEKLVDEKLNGRLKQQQEAENTHKAFVLLREVYGSDYGAKSAFIKCHSNDPAMIRMLDELAKTNPAAAVRLIKGTVPPEEINNKPGQNAPGIENVGSAEAKIPAGTGFTYTYIKKVRAEDPKTYKDPAFRAKFEAAVAKYEAEGKDFFAT